MVKKKKKNSFWRSQSVTNLSIFHSHVRLQSATEPSWGDLSFPPSLHNTRSDPSGTMLHEYVCIHVDTCIDLFPSHVPPQLNTPRGQWLIMLSCPPYSQACPVPASTQHGLDEWVNERSAYQRDPRELRYWNHLPSREKTSLFSEGQYFITFESW